MGRRDKANDADAPPEIAMVGDLSENESDLIDKLMDVDPGGTCVLYFDSLGGSPYSGIALSTLIRLRDLRATGVVLGECSSAAIWPFAACRKRLVTRYSVLLFHPMKWQSEENVALAEAAEWARHFSQLETDMDQLLARLFGVEHQVLQKWNTPGRYVSGPDMAEAGLAELIELEALSALRAKPRH